MFDKCWEEMDHNTWKSLPQAGEEHYREPISMNASTEVIEKYKRALNKENHCRGKFYEARSYYATCLKEVKESIDMLEVKSTLENLIEKEGAKKILGELLAERKSKNQIKELVKKCKVYENENSLQGDLSNIVTSIRKDKSTLKRAREHIADTEKAKKDLKEKVRKFNEAYQNTNTIYNKHNKNREQSPHLIDLEEDVSLSESYNRLENNDKEFIDREEAIVTPPIIPQSSVTREIRFTDARARADTSTTSSESIANTPSDQDEDLIYNQPDIEMPLERLIAAENPAQNLENEFLEQQITTSPTQDALQPRGVDSIARGNNNISATKLPTLDIESRAEEPTFSNDSRTPIPVSTPPLPYPEDTRNFSSFPIASGPGTETAKINKEHPHFRVAKSLEVQDADHHDEIHNQPSASSVPTAPQQKHDKSLHTISSQHAHKDVVQAEYQESKERQHHSRTKTSERPVVSTTQARRNVITKEPIIIRGIPLKVVSIPASQSKALTSEPDRPVPLLIDTVSSINLAATPSSIDNTMNSQQDREESVTTETISPTSSTSDSKTNTDTRIGDNAPRIENPPTESISPTQEALQLSTPSAPTAPAQQEESVNTTHSHNSLGDTNTPIPQMSRAGQQHNRTQASQIRSTSSSQNRELYSLHSKAEDAAVPVNRTYKRLTNEERSSSTNHPSSTIPEREENMIPQSTSELVSEDTHSSGPAQNQQILTSATVSELVQQFEAFLIANRNKTRLTSRAELSPLLHSDSDDASSISSSTTRRSRDNPIAPLSKRDVNIQFPEVPESHTKKSTQPVVTKNILQIKSLISLTKSVASYLYKSPWYLVRNLVDTVGSLYDLSKSLFKAGLHSSLLVGTIAAVAIPSMKIIDKLGKLPCELKPYSMIWDYAWGGLKNTSSRAFNFVASNVSNIMPNVVKNHPIASTFLASGAIGIILGYCLWGKNKNNNAKRPQDGKRRPGEDVRNLTPPSTEGDNNNGRRLVSRIREVRRSPRGAGRSR